MTIILHDVYETPGAAELLWELLAERDPIANISHKQMPTMEEHLEFVRGRPYAEHWFIFATFAETFVVGACYLTKPPRASAAGNEIGVQIFRRHQRRGYASAALAQMIERHKGKRLLANIALGNEKSAKLFQRYGFIPIQATFELVSQ